MPTSRVLAGDVASDPPSIEPSEGLILLTTTDALCPRQEASSNKPVSKGFSSSVRWQGFPGNVFFLNEVPIPDGGYEVEGSQFKTAHFFPNSR